MHVQGKDLTDLIGIAYPDYKGRRIQIEPFKPMSLNSFWDNGHRDYFTFINLETKKVLPVEQNGTMFDKKNYSIEILPENLAIIQRTFSGMYQYIIIYVNSSQLNLMLPKPVELNKIESIVLSIFKGIKSSYRFEEFKNNFIYSGFYQESDYYQALESLKAKGLIKSNNSVSLTGRNTEVKDFLQYHIDIVKEKADQGR